MGLEDLINCIQLGMRTPFLVEDCVCIGNPWHLTIAEMLRL